MNMTLLTSFHRDPVQRGWSGPKQHEVEFSPDQL